MTSIYPVMLIIEGRRCVVVGGGTVAERKVEALLEARGDVVVVSPEATEGLAKLAEQGAIEWRKREAEEADVLEGFVAIIATDDHETNARLAAVAEAAGKLVNAVDQPPDCNFYVPASVQRGPVTLTISTGGSSPALAKRIRKQIQAQFGPEYGELAELMGRLRPLASELIETQAERAKAWERILESPVLGLLRQGKADEAEALAREVLEAAGKDGVG